MIKEPQTVGAVHTRVSFADVESVYLLSTNLPRLENVYLERYTLEDRANEVSFVCDEKIF